MTAHDTTIPFETFLRVRAATGGAFSPDGRSLAFLMDTSGTPQVYRVTRPGEEPQPLTSTGEIVRSVHWSPDGRQLLFAMDHGGSEREQLFLLRLDGPDVTSPQALTEAPEIVHTFGAWSPNSRQIAYAANARSQAFFDLWVLDVDSGERRCVLQRDGHYNVVDWSPDGKRLLVLERIAAVNSNLYTLELESGELSLLTPHSGDARYTSSRFLPDSRTVVTATDQDRDFLALARLRPGPSPEPLLAEDADVEIVDVSEDGRTVAAALNREGWSEVALGNLSEAGLEISRRLSIPGVVSYCRLARNGTRAAVSIAGPTCNPNVWGVDTATGVQERWTAAPWGELDPGILVTPQSLRYPTHDGRQIPTLLYRPLNAAPGPLPAIVHVHGGPESQDRPDFRAAYQYLAHRGYAVLAPNVRGSTGYGNAYSHLDDREKRYDALRDVEYAWRWLASSGVGDPRRIAIMGGSYGGFTVLACLTRQPDLWAAGVDIVGIANFETFFKNTGPWRRHLRASEYGDPERDAALLRDLSPIHAVEKIRAPLMVIQGANDPRVPQEESDQMVERLRALGRPVEYLVFEDEGHGIVKLQNRLTAYTAIARFLDRALQPAAVDG